MVATLSILSSVKMRLNDSELLGITVAFVRGDIRARIGLKVSGVDAGTGMHARCLGSVS